MTKPRYQLVADDVRERLRREEFAVGSFLPAISALQKHYGVSGLNTVRQGLGVLIEEGWIESHQGRGTVVVALPPALDSRAEQLRRLSQTVDELATATATAGLLAERARDLVAALEV